VVRRLHHLVHLLNLVNDMGQKMLELRRYVVDSFLIQFLHLQDVAHLVVLQNLDEQNLDVHLPYLDVVHQFLVVVVVDVELHPLSRMDYFLDVVDVELRHQLRMDYFLGAELRELLVLPALALLHLPQPLLLLLQLFLHRVMP
jgi:hypothetical protein